ncbi:MAG: Zn-dependent hydrolase [Betaproteobacteria bacterium]|nr:Zn-dependent hydrolase [Betaproteobacteria bacterium]
MLHDLQALTVNGERLWQSLADMAQIGATPKGGVRRIALTAEDKAGRDQFVAWCKAQGLAITIDRMGNIFARREGADSALPPVISGSHLDTQPSGGRFDGCYGVMAALEVCRTLDDHGITTRHPIEIAVWTNEEGTRFTPVMEGSGVFAGKFTVEHARAQKDVNGVTMGEALDAIGYAGDVECGKPVAAYFEAHIEQGPVLENANEVIGVVSGGLGQRWFDVTVTGMDAHAGPTPMHLRRDALQGATPIVAAIDAIGRAHPDTRATVGHMRVEPNSRNVIPGTVHFSVDLRAPTDAQLSAMETQVREAAARECAARKLEHTMVQTVYFPPTPFAKVCKNAVRSAAQRYGYPHRELVSGAGHDAIYLASVCPAGMIFVPCKDGISHNEIEDARPEHITAGCNVLLQAVMEMAGVV